MVEMLMSQNHELDLTAQSKHRLLDVSASPTTRINHQTAGPALFGQQVGVRAKRWMADTGYGYCRFDPVHVVGSRSHDDT
jgi:hypothetical protein